MDKNINLNELIKSETIRISQKYNKDFLDCEDIIKITGLGRDNVRQLLRSRSFPTTKEVELLVALAEEIKKAQSFKDLMEDGSEWQQLAMTKMAK